MQLSLAGTPAAGPLGYHSWALFEWARNPYVILITIYIFAPYFTTSVVEDPVRGQSLLGYANSLAGALIAIMAPLLGAVADKKGRRKPWIAGFILLMIPAVWMLWFAKPGGAGLGIYPTLALIMLIAVVFEFSAVFHNAMLPSVAPASKIGMVSGLALAYGNFAGLSLMIFVLYAFSLPGEVPWAFIPDRPLFGLDPATAEPDRIVAPMVAVWMLLFTLPLLAFTPDGRDPGHGIRSAVTQGLTEVWRTVRQLRHYANVARYLLARMLFNDGMVGILIFGGVYAAGTFGWGTTTLLLFGIITSFSAAVGAVLGGWLDDRLGSKLTVLIAVGGTALLLAVAVTIQPDSILFIPYEGEGTLWELPYFNTLPEFLYFANTQLFAMCITVAFASARTMMARLAPPTMITQFFGLYALSGTATAFLAPLLVGIFTSSFASQQVGYASLVILLAAGFVLMLFVREEQAEAAA
ncbi:MAG: MFS transporter [Pseudomonadales bacterium]